MAMDSKTVEGENWIAPLAGNGRVPQSTTIVGDRNYNYLTIGQSITQYMEDATLVKPQACSLFFPFLPSFPPYFPMLLLPHSSFLSSDSFLFPCYDSLPLSHAENENWNFHCRFMLSLTSAKWYSQRPFSICLTCPIELWPSIFK